MPNITKARFDALVRLETTFGAQGAKLEACINDLGLRLSAANADAEGAWARVVALEAQLAEVAEQHCDARIIKDKAALMLRAKQLSAAGVPCSMRGDVIIHAHTRAVLAQVAS